jgi:hypothetical protein
MRQDQSRSSTVDLAGDLLRLSESGIVSAAYADRLLELRRLLEESLPAVELFGEVKTMQAILQELGP